MAIRTTALLLLLAAVILPAAEYRIELPAGGGKDAVYFLDFSRFPADSASFRLTTSAGQDIPFSFDWRLVPAPLKPGARPDGFYSKAQAPASAKRFAVPGWLSFAAVPGAAFYEFSFQEGAEAPRPRPNPAVRAWWIEVMRDPDLRDLKHLAYPKDTVKVLARGIEFQRSFSWRLSALQVDERCQGRRIVALLTAMGQDTSFYALPFPNAVITQVGAIHPYLKLTPGVETDVCTQGLIANRPGEIFRGSRAMFHIAKPPLVIYSHHVQLPPQDHSVDLRLASTLVNLGDTLQVVPSGLQQETLYPLRFALPGNRVLPASRLDVWGDDYDVAVRLLTLKGEVRQSYPALTFKLTGVEPGEYVLEAALLSRRHNPEPIIRKEFALTVQQGPQW